MMRNLRGSLLIASMLVVLWTTSSQACHRRRACQSSCDYQSGYTYGSPQGYYGGGTAGYPGGYGYGQSGYAQPGYSQPGYSQPGSGYDFGRPGYNPGGLGGPASGIGVRPGLGAGGFGPGR